MTFGKLDGISGISGQRIAFHSMTSLGGSKVAIIGGAQSAQLTFNDASVVGAGKRTMALSFPNEADNLSSLVYVVDFASGGAETASLSSPVLGAHAAWVGENEVLVTGGVVPLNMGMGLVPTNRAELCSLSGTPSCSSIGGLAVDRASHCGLCKDGDRFCHELFLFGGVQSSNPDTVQSALGEIFTTSDQQFTPVQRLSSQLTGNVAFPSCIRAGNTNYLVGGTTQRNLPPSIPPYVLDEKDGGVGAIEITGLDKLDTAFRLHTAHVVLNDGSILVSGGLDDTGRAITSAYIIDGSAIQVAVNMNQARFGHTMTVLTSGRLAGAVLIAGGFTTNGAGNISFASGAEIYIPAAR